MCNTSRGCDLCSRFCSKLLCKHQNECQGLHWRQKQVTIMPSVVHYRCAKCNQLVTYEIVHITNDMKHDAHMVKIFTERSINVLKHNNVNIRKIISLWIKPPPSTRIKQHLITLPIVISQYRKIILG